MHARETRSRQEFPANLTGGSAYRVAWYALYAYFASHEDHEHGWNPRRNPANGQVRYLTVRQAAERLNQSHPVHLRQDQLGEIRAKKFGRSVRIIAQSLDAYEADAPEITGT